MRITSVSLVIALLVVAGCRRSPGGGALDAFITVNDSLGLIKARLDQRHTGLPPIPFVNLGCAEFQLLSDSVAMAAEDVERALSPLFDDLAGVPQDDLEAGEQSFAKAQQGETLFEAVTKAYVVASRIAPDDSTRARIKELRASFFPHISAEAWYARDIENAPRAAVVTILSKVRIDIQRLRGSCDNALLQACLARNSAVH